MVTVVVAALSAILIVLLPSMLLVPASKTEDRESSASVTADPAEFVMEHMMKYRDRNVASLLNDYLPDGTITWSGESGGLSGTYRGLGAIRTFLSIVLTGSEDVEISVTELSTERLGTKSATVSFKTSVKGRNFVIGRFEGEANVRCELVLTDTGWKIASEQWHYSRFNSESPGSTTFPQWSWSSLRGGAKSESERDALKELAYNFSGAFALLIVAISVILLFSFYRTTLSRARRQ
ncbi:MAG: hypothetical protein QW410_01285 [Nitrososphaerota archaeon]|nr:nuclear transport factor 2 family protein [Candidatus Calditenuis fumarioli]